MLKLWIILVCLCFNLVISNFTEELSTCFEVNDDVCSTDSIRYFYYSDMSPYGRQLVPLRSDQLDYNLGTSLKVLIHGFNSSYTETPTAEILPRLIKLPNVNIISVDYAQMVTENCYQESVVNARRVGTCLGKFLMSLAQHMQVYPQNIHLIGFGIGAHVAAFASNFLEKTIAKVGHITALDPAKPMYLTSNIADRLDDSDADFVDVIHTDISLHGILQPIGHADFYPNMGVTQPNCGPINILSTHECYHKRSAEYYAESISPENIFMGFQCEDLYTFVMNQCQPGPGVNEAPLGLYVPHHVRGSYFLATYNDPPYAKSYDFSNLDHNLYGKTYMGDAFLKQIADLGEGARQITREIGK